MAFEVSGAEETGFLESLYERSHEVFTFVCKHFGDTELAMADKPLFCEQAGRFYLWGKTFDEGRFDTVRKQSPPLYLTIVRLLAVVARMLLQRKSFI